MIVYVFVFVYGCFGLVMLFCLYCVVCVFGMGDWVLVLDMLIINVIVLLMIFGIDWGIGIYFEVLLLFVMLGFILIVVYVKFVLCGDIIE